MAANGASTHERSTRPIRPEDRSPRGAHEGSSRAARPAEVRRESFQGILEGDDQVSVVFSIDEPPRTVRFLVQLPSKLDRHGYARVQREVEQETRSTWRALLLLVKGKLEGVARGVVEFDEEFFAHIVTENGATVFERFQAGELRDRPCSRRVRPKSKRKRKRKTQSMRRRSHREDRPHRAVDRHPGRALCVRARDVRRRVHPVRAVGEDGRELLGESRANGGEIPVEVPIRESRRMRQKRRKRILRAATNTIDKIAVFEAAGWRCAICGRHTPPRAKGKEKPDSPTLDHIVPFSRGGTHTLDNVQLACGACNSSKDHGPQHEVSAQTQGEAARRGLTMREYLRLVGRRW